MVRGGAKAEAEDLGGSLRYRPMTLEPNRLPAGVFSASL
jgi:hypothetical protein